MLAWLGVLVLRAHAGGPAVVWGRGVGEKLRGWGFDGGAGEEGEGSEEKAGEEVAWGDGGGVDEGGRGGGMWSACAG